MARNLDALLSEADHLIETKLAAKPVVEDDIFKLAEQLKSANEPENDYTLLEKVASAVALVDTIINLDQLVKIAAFEEKAKQSGVSDGKIAEFFEKKASVPFRSVLDLLA